MAGSSSTTTKGCTPGNKFEDNGVSCYILANIGQLFFQFGAIVLLKTISSIIARQKYSDLSQTSKIRQAFERINNMIDVQFWMMFVDSTQIDVYISIFLNFIVYDPNSAYASLNFGICVFSFVFYVWIVITVFYLSTKVQELGEGEVEPGYQEYYRAWLWLREGLKRNSFFSRHHNVIMYIRDPLVAACLVFGHDIPVFQVASIFVINALSTFLYVWFRPFKDRMENILEITNNGVFSFVTGIFVIIAVFDIPVAVGYHGIGWFTMATLFAMLCFNFGLILKEIWEKMLEKKAELQAWWAKRNNPRRPLSALSGSGTTGKTSQVTNFFSNRNRLQGQMGYSSYQSCQSHRDWAGKAVTTAARRMTKISY
jgi:hypothetical protein